VTNGTSTPRYTRGMHFLIEKLKLVEFVEFVEGGLSLNLAMVVLNIPLLQP